MPPEGMVESPFVPHGRTGSSFTPRFVDPYPSLSLTVIMICIHDGKGSGSRCKRPKGVGCVKGDPRPSSMQEGREVPGPIRGLRALCFVMPCSSRNLLPSLSLNEDCVDIDLMKCGLNYVHIIWCMRGTVRNNVKDLPKLKPGQGVFGHLPLRGGRIIRDLVGVSVGLSIIPKSVLGVIPRPTSRMGIDKVYLKSSKPPIERPRRDASTGIHTDFVDEFSRSTVLAANARRKHRCDSDLY
ncbi:hypothetical protein CRG98_012466 [Punica granatum]|uniref:Uncharacterized protein n=1 Tax=Punica granatum TaxID=22663 RepID=A0A2I0KF76_PUNGR|nr:hypothetical protein CRG98_012466 [Punica granatum]